LEYTYDARTHKR